MHAFPQSLIAAFALSLNLLLAGCAGSGDEKKGDDEDIRPTEKAVVAPEGNSGAAGSIEAPTSTPSSGRGLDEVQKAFVARKESFRRVNSARLSQNAGTLAVTVTFAPSGEVVECRMLSTDFREDPAFNAAVMAEVWRLRIAPRADVGEFTVASYPLAFSARSEAIAAPPSVPIASPPPPPAVSPRLR